MRITFDFITYIHNIYIATWQYAVGCYEVKLISRMDKKYPSLKMNYKYSWLCLSIHNGQKKKFCNTQCIQMHPQTHTCMHARMHTHARTHKHTAQEFGHQLYVCIEANCMHLDRSGQLHDTAWCST